LIILLLFPDGNQCCIISGGESFGEWCRSSSLFQGDSKKKT
jgi:hypothetical protein